jgi:hypothetical protein
MVATATYFAPAQNWVNPDVQFAVEAALRATARHTFSVSMRNAALTGGYPVTDTCAKKYLADAREALASAADDQIVPMNEDANEFGEFPMTVPACREMIAAVIESFQNC